MSVLCLRKKKVVLADYPYQRDIHHRLFISRLTVFESTVLREILDSSLNLSVPQLAEALETDVSSCRPAVQKLEASELLKCSGDFCFVDKELRKYYRCQIRKMDEGFEPDVEFIQEILNQVPIHLLPQWYNLPRTTDHIFQAIFDKHLSTPRIYERYLTEFLSDQPLLKKIVDTVFKAPGLAVAGADLCAAFNLSPEKFEECLLLLELNFICCLCYKKSGDSWEEVVKPFSEWGEYLRFVNGPSTPLLEASKVKPVQSEDFAFLKQMSAFLEKVLEKPCPIERCPPEILDKILFMRLGVIEEGRMVAAEPLESWLSRDLHSRALTMTRHPVAVEKGLVRYIGAGWVFVDDFLKGFYGVFGAKEKIMLKKQGKRWRYTLPVYTPDEIELIRTTLTVRLVEAGVVELGYLGDKLCFRVTAFGESLFD